MTTFISGLLAVIMMMCGTGTGSVTVRDAAVTIDGESIALAPEITAAYSVEEGSAAAEIYMNLDGEKLFKTDVQIDETGVRFTARDDVAFAITSELIDNMLSESGIDAAEAVAGMEKIAGAEHAADKQAAMTELSYQILNDWTADFASETVTETVDGQEVQLKHIKGTVDNAAMMDAVDTSYRTLIGDQAYESFVGMLGAVYADEGDTFKNLSDVYAKLGLGISIDIDAIVNDEMFGTWDMVIRYAVAEDAEKTTALIPEGIAMHMVNTDEKHSEAEVRLQATEDMPVELVCTVSQNGDDMTMDYSFAAMDDAGMDLTTVTMNLLLTEAEQRFAMNVAAGEEYLQIDYAKIGDAGRFTAEFISDGTVQYGLGFNFVTGGAPIGTNVKNVTLIENADALGSIDFTRIMTGYMSDAGRLINDDSVQALMGKIAEHAEMMKAEEAAEAEAVEEAGEEAAEETAA